MVQSSTTGRVVEAVGLTKVFKDFWLRNRVRAVDHIDFHIDKGEIFGLLGPNGSGKSTTIKIILGLLHATSGRIRVLDKLPNDVATKRRIGYLPEESYLYPFLNARETLDYYGKIFELNRRERTRRIDELLEMVGLTATQFRPVRDYSKGMQRRIGIAQALINDPEFLILDEPTTGLDPIGTRQIKDLIIELGRRGKTVLLSSHLLSDVEDCVDRMVILYGGKIQREGTCDGLLEVQDRSVIETDALDEETVSEIDRLLRQRSGGSIAVNRVARPRQRLEELFMDIVNRAREEEVETSGAQAGGETAAFLRAGAAAEGAALVDHLVQAGETHEEVPDETPAPADAGPDDAVLDSLLNKGRDDGEAAPPASTQPTTNETPDEAAPPVPDNVDRGVLDSLMDGGDPEKTS